MWRIMKCGDRNRIKLNYWWNQKFKDLYFSRSQNGADISDCIKWLKIMNNWPHPWLGLNKSSPYFFLQRKKHLWKPQKESLEIEMRNKILKGFYTFLLSVEDNLITVIVRAKISKLQHTAMHIHIKYEILHLWSKMALIYIVCGCCLIMPFQSENVNSPTHI